MSKTEGTIRAEELRERTKQFAIRVINLYRALPKAQEARIIGNQLLRSATSVAANYRAVCRARTKAEFTAKLGLVVEEADETVFWLELLVDSNIVSARLMEDILAEANELIAVFSAAYRTAKRRKS